MEPHRARALLAVIFASTVLIALNATMLGVALPTIVRDLQATATEGTWMLLSYLVVNGSALVLSGQLADSLAPRPVFLAGLGVFTVTSAALAVSTDPTAFVVARAVQGAGAAMLLSTAAAMIAVAYVPERRNGAMGVYLAGFAVAQVSGPVLGGLVTTWLGWRWLFVVGVVIGLGAFAAGWGPVAELPRRDVTPPGRSEGAAGGWRIDVAGNLLIFAGTTLSLVALSGVRDHGWADPRTVVPLVATALLVPVFVAVERKVRTPAVATDLLRDPAFTLANLAGMLLAVPRMVPALLFSLWFQGAGGDGPTRAALKITPLALGVTCGSLLADRACRRATPDVVALACAGATTAGAVLLLVGVWQGNPALVLAALGLVGLFTGVFSTVNSTAIMNLLPVSRAGNVNGIRTTAQTVGLSLGTALLLSLGTAGLTPSDAAAFYAGRASALSSPAVLALRHGYVVASAVVVVLCVVAVVASVVLARRASSGTPIVEVTARS